MLFIQNCNWKFFWKQDESKNHATLLQINVSLAIPYTRDINLIVFIKNSRETEY